MDKGGQRAYTAVSGDEVWMNVVLSGKLTTLHGLQR